MSNALYDRATRVVSYALFPAFLVIGGLLIWELQPLPYGPTYGERPLRPVDEALVVPDLRTPRQDAPAPVQKKVVAAQPAAAASEKPKVRHCEEYALYDSKTEKVYICTWE